MHEISVMTEVVETVRRMARERGAERVLKVNLQVGELTFLAEEQMRFAFDVLKADGHGAMEGAEVEIETIRARGTCAACGYSGGTRVQEEADLHFKLPTIDCPRCGQRLEITEGRDLYIRDIVMEVPDGDEAGDGGVSEVESSRGNGGDGDA